MAKQQGGADALLWLAQAQRDVIAATHQKDMGERQADFEAKPPPHDAEVLQIEPGAPAARLRRELAELGSGEGAADCGTRGRTRGAASETPAALGGGGSKGAAELKKLNDEIIARSTASSVALLQPMEKIGALRSEIEL
jgi:hypothetical protein